jgi:rhamnulokinase
MTPRESAQSSHPVASDYRSRTSIAVDLGASSCRVSLLQWQQGSGNIRTVHRFPNSAITIDDRLYWDIERICAEVAAGIRKCAQIAEEPIDSIGIDGWGVDYVRVGSDGAPLSNPFCYRDARAERGKNAFWKVMPPQRIYELTGIQHMALNTLYQLYEDKCEGLPTGKFWLNVPEYTLYRLGGKPVAEYTSAANSQMLRAGKLEWCDEVFEAAGFDKAVAPKIVPPGTVLGPLKGPFSDLPALRNTLLIAPACHDTGSAVAGIPSEGDDWAFLSSGTWSLLGSVLSMPCTNDLASQHNFSNEGGLGGRVRFLKNLNGMWLIQECQREWVSMGKNWDIATLVCACEILPPPKFFLQVDDPSLLLPDKMLERINSVLQKQGLACVSTDPANAPETANLIFHSLAARYAEVLQYLSSVTGKTLRRLYVVGGGSKNEFLNRLIEEATGLEVRRGAAESSTIGNLAIQLAVMDGAMSAEKGVLPEAVAEWSRHLVDVPQT